MKPIKILILLILFTPAWSTAGDIYATISKDKAPFANEAIKIIDANGKEIKTVTTDANGFFTVSIPQAGQFKIVLVNPEYKEAAADFASNNSPSSYNFSLFNEDGLWKLRKQ